jgi:hypothetical protein
MSLPYQLPSLTQLAFEACILPADFLSGKFLVKQIGHLRVARCTVCDEDVGAGLAAYDDALPLRVLELCNCYGFVDERHCLDVDTVRGVPDAAGSSEVAERLVLWGTARKSNAVQQLNAACRSFNDAQALSGKVCEYSWDRWGQDLANGCGHM